MEQTRVARQITSFYKKTYDNSISAINTLQDQTERMVNLSLDQSPWLPEQSKNLVNTWVKAYRGGCDNFTAAADAQYKKFEAMFNPGEKVDPIQSVNKRKSI
jgi:hypothetical protein